MCLFVYLLALAPDLKQTKKNYENITLTLSVSPSTIEDDHHDVSQ